MTVESLGHAPEDPFAPDDTGVLPEPDGQIGPPSRGTGMPGLPGLALSSVLVGPTDRRVGPQRRRGVELVAKPAAAARCAVETAPPPARWPAASRWRRILTAACLVAGCLVLWRGLPSSPWQSEPHRAASLTAAAPAEAEYVTADIEDLRVGDVVLAVDPETGELGPHRIVDVFVRTAYRLRVLSIRGPDGQEGLLRTTDEHPFWAVDRDAFVSAGELQPGEQLLAPDGQPSTLASSAVEEHPEGVAVYNFEVEGAHTYFVLPGNVPTLHGLPVLVHNATSGGCPIGSPKLSQPLKAKLQKIINYGRKGIKQITGRVSRKDARKLAEAFVGKGHTQSSYKDSWILKSSDGLRVVRGPASKTGVHPVSQQPHSATGNQMNFQTRQIPSGDFDTNVHLDVVP